ncbi:MAG: arginine--tRNA ligase [Chromatiales bacterium]
MKRELRTLLTEAITELTAQGALSISTTPAVQIERTRDPDHGDFSSNLALMLAREAGHKPRELAEKIRAAMPPSKLVDKVLIAGPGFINFFLRQEAYQSVVADVMAAGADFGCDSSAQRGKILVEFVSANPTGPMHVGHGRGAAYGDSLCNILAASGWDVHREYYINDAGRQADILAVSIWVRYLQRCGETLPFPARGYPGDYTRDIAERLYASHGEALRAPAKRILQSLPADPAIQASASEEEKARVKGQQERYIDALVQRARDLLGESFGTLQQSALDDQLAEIRATLDAFGVRFDEWCSEKRLVASGAVRKAMERLRAGGHVYEQDGAVWLRTTTFGDEKDRVLIKADGSATYFGNDLAYHVDKLDRGYTRLLDVWGADHHGYIARVRAAIEAITGRRDALQVQLVQFVTLSSGRMGKRSGNFVTLKELISEAGKDATRYFYLLRSHDQHLEFDLDLAKSASSENPVYYVQYAHARICSVFRQLAEKGMQWNPARGSGRLACLTEPQEQALLITLSRYPEVVEQAAVGREPHQIAHHLVSLANDFHAYYNAHRFLTAREDLRDARLNLCAATRQVLCNGLALLGVSAPEVM